MKNAKKILALLLCAILLIGCSVAGTLAFLKAETQTVKNTFTVGKVEFGGEGQIGDGLSEAAVNEYGEKLNAAGDVAEEGDELATRVTANKYKLIPNHTYVKDPTIHIAGKSEACYLFVKVENGIADIEAAGNTTIAKQMEAKGWLPLTVNGVAVTNVYYLNRTVSTVDNEAGTDVVIFDSFTLAKDAAVADYADAQINITAYGVQADGFADAAAAWDAAGF